MSDDGLIQGLRKGYIDESVIASEGFRPQLITNNPGKREKVIVSLKQEMETCDEFMFSVAFINSGGVNALAQEFRDLDRRGVKGRIIASQYQNFTEPNALKALLKNSNVEVRVITEDVSKMHSKCYIFRHGDIYDVIIGSSNLTNSALCENIEWNLKINSKDSGEIIKDIISEFEHDFSLATIVDDGWIEVYSRIYNDQRRLKRALAEKSIDLHEPRGRPQPNRMQKEALESLHDLREKGADRALVISATGSGKTYLSAFDVRCTGMKFLYIVHRIQILNKSMQSFEKVMEGEKSIEKYDPGVKNFGADCTFVTIQTLSRPDVLNAIPEDEFKYILIDEVHHIGAETYQRVLNHFKPRFLLGMTATPDRTDGFDVYGYFDYNIAYDIRLKEAMEYRLICPFHYFGISDLSFDGTSDDDYRHFLDTHLDQRLDHIISNAEYFGYCGNRLKGLVFCRNLKEAELYSHEFRKRGYRTEWVSGNMDKSDVEICIERLESDDSASVLDYIFTADLFNEGVDIPSVNQVIMLRPTDSPIVFIQQLGRGLRNHPDKEYVVILDFIGNYERNYNIPMALTDDRSYNKAETRRAVSSGDLMIPGNSTISFDEVAKSRIYDSIDRSDFTELRMICEAYSNLKMRLGRIPRLIDFEKNGTICATNLFSKYKSYYEFLVKKDKDDFGQIMDDVCKAYLEQITKYISFGKRRDEIAVLKSIIDGSDIEFDIHHGSNVLKVMDGSFYKNRPIIDVCDGKITSSVEFRRALSNDCFRDQVEQILELGEYNYSKSYSHAEDNLVLYMRYTYDDVCRMLNWPENFNAQSLSGYFHHKLTNTFPVFIVVGSQKYDDRFIDRRTLVALSKPKEGSSSKRMGIISNSSHNGVKIYLFMSKSNKDKGSKEFYYLGRMDFVRFLDDGKPISIEYRLRNEVRADLYEYFQAKI